MRNVVVEKYKLRTKDLFHAGDQLAARTGRKYVELYVPHNCPIKAKTVFGIVEAPFPFGDKCSQFAYQKIRLSIYRFGHLKTGIC
jgi:hypothetical protein